MGHTPGPWTPHGWGDNDYEIHAAEGTVCNVPGFDDDTAESDMAEHNARLIAAAPELLAALNQVLDVLTLCMDWQSIPGLEDAVELATEAINKAEGRSE